MSAGVATRAAADAAFRGAFARLKLPEAPRDLAQVSYVDLEGRFWPLDMHRGQWMIFNLWATWCPPCVQEMPSLDRLAGMTEQTGWRVLALSSDRAGEVKVPAFFAQYRLTNLRIHLDPMGKIMRAWEARGLPTTLLLDPAGREVGRLEGAAEWDSPDALAALSGVRARFGEAASAK